MLRSLSNEVRACYEHAQACGRKAKAARTGEIRKGFLQLENSWLKLAQSHELSIRLRDFTKENERKRKRYELELLEGSTLLRTLAPKISDVFITEELDRRRPGEVDSLREKVALQELADLMADNPAEVLPKFVALAMEMAKGSSAGLSLYEDHPPPGVFRWHHLHGTLARFVGTTTPRDFSPCGVVLDLDAPVLTAHPERAYDWLAEQNVPLAEVLLVPLRLGRGDPTGTLWIVSDEDGHFHREHARVMTELASFVAIALQTLRTEQQLQHALDDQLILAREMTHRIKNLFAMTDGLIRLSAKDAATTAEMSALLSGRLHALADAHSLVRRDFGEIGTAAPTSDLNDLIQKIVLPHERPGASRFSVNGPPVRCDERGSNGIALIFHELATNAAKHGSLKIDTGRVDMAWRRQDDRLILSWSERGGPAVAGPPSKNGFGGELVQRVAEQFGATLDYDWQREGLVVTLTLPANAIVRAGF